MNCLTSYYALSSDNTCFRITCSLLLAALYIRKTNLSGAFHEILYLKDVLITGFTAVKSQVELLVDIVDNAPALEILSEESIKRFA